jgi:hypothetical protein
MHQYPLVTLPSRFLYLIVMSHYKFDGAFELAGDTEECCTEMSFGNFQIKTTQCRRTTASQSSRCASCVIRDSLSKTNPFFITFRQRRPPTAKDGNRKPYGRLRLFVLPQLVCIQPISSPTETQKCLRSFKVAWTTSTRPDCQPTETQ